ncbi:MAG: PQQ-binding-like beta-propeller repeat protein [Myxococcota bacterium]|nr:PQQ-binding-like beta-propeller repeat protein [Myxococcota bacterium]
MSLSWLLLALLGAVPTPAPVNAQRWGVQWSARVQSATSSKEQLSSPTIVPKAGIALVGSDAGELLAIELSSGAVRWRHKMPGRVSGKPVVYGPAVLVTADDGFLHALQLKDGTPVWAVPIGTEPVAPPVVSRQRVYLQTGLDQLVVLDLRDGSELWTCDRYEDGGRPNAVTIFGHTSPTPVLLPAAARSNAKRVVLVGSSSGHLTAYNDDPTDGECDVVWERKLGNTAEDFADVDAGPVVLDGVIYTAAFNAGVFALRLADGRLIWKRPMLKGVHRIAVDKQRVYIAARGRVAALTSDKGKTLWKYSFEGGVPTQPVVRQGRLWFGRDDGPMTLLRASDGQALQILDTGTGFSATPEVRSRLALVYSNGGMLYLVAKGLPDAVQ